MSAESLVSLRFGPLPFAVPVQAVLEVAEVPRVTPLPLAPSHLRGLVSWRGRPVPLVCPQTYLGVLGDAAGERPRAARGEAERMTVVEADSMRVGLLTDGIGGIVEHDTVRDAALPGEHPAARFVRGEIAGSDGVVLVLDLQAFLEAARWRS